MCFFPFSNNLIQSQAYKKGLREFDCGSCPECLAKRSRLWALRCCAESMYNYGVMVTLTYDQYMRDDNGKILVDSKTGQPLETVDTRPVSVRDCQLFIKRLRKNMLSRKKRDKIPMKDIYMRLSACNKEITKELDELGYKRFDKERTNIRNKNWKRTCLLRELEKTRAYNKEVMKYNNSLKTPLKYLLTAEYGKRTHRSHYHAILFGVSFDDKVFYKKSKRGNRIYKSNTLDKIWKHGICTIDSVNISGKVARYCTKYCAKDGRSDDTFMLMSRGIGDKWLLEKFNGKSYWLDGREYSIPKQIWNKVIENRYKNNYIFKKNKASYKYRSLKWFLEKTSPNELNYFSIAWYGGSGCIWTPKHISYSQKERGGNFCGHEKRFLLCAYANADLQKRKNRIFRNFRDSDKQYQRYLQYWKNKAEIYNQSRPSVLTRVQRLPNEKYFSYKQACMSCLSRREQCGSDSFIRPRSSARGRYERYILSHLPFKALVIKGQMTPKLPKREYKVFKINEKYVDLREIDIELPKITQISMF